MTSIKRQRSSFLYTTEKGTKKHRGSVSSDSRRVVPPESKDIAQVDSSLQENMMPGTSYQEIEKYQSNATGRRSPRKSALLFLEDIAQLDAFLRDNMTDERSTQRRRSTRVDVSGGIMDLTKTADDEPIHWQHQDSLDTFLLNGVEDLIK